ncbi:MAG: DEAD/DEAH box helicase [Phycisphaerales bacterium]
MSDLFTTDITFAELGLRESLVKGLEKRGYVHPTGIQAVLIPHILAGRDVLGQAKTGTGKTAAFALPVINTIDIDAGVQSLILAPTRELAVQIAREMREFARFTPVHITPIFGGAHRRRQIDHLRKNPHIVVGTPGRVQDLQAAGELDFSCLRSVVLDEVDRMLDIGFRDDIRRILKLIQQKHQTIFVSATISPEIETLARQFMNNPEKIVSSEGSLTVAAVQQSHLLVNRWDKRKLLAHLLTHEEPALTLVFCATKREVDRVQEYLIKNHIDAHAIHGDMYQRKRDRVMQQFRDGQLSVLIASDVAARGLDVDGVSHVINYDIPNDPEVYVHRIGRTARLDKKGIAWTFVTPDEGPLLTAVEQMINIEVPRKQYDDFKPGPVPQAVQTERDDAEARSDRMSQDRSRTKPSVITETDAEDATRFPGGVVPKSSGPARRLGGRVRGRRR